MTELFSSIPDDLARCHELIRAMIERIARLEQQLRDRESQLDETCASSEELKRSYDCLKEEYLALKRILHGPRRERLPEDPGQGHLFDTPEPPATPAEPAADDADGPVKAKRRKGHGRRPIPDHLPRQDVPHDVPDEQKTCACGRAKTQIGEDTTEQLDYVPGRIVVLRHTYPKYACSHCKDGVTAAPREANPIAGGLATPGLQAYVLVTKFFTHTPLYRQQDDLARAGVFFSRSTLCGWLEQDAVVLKPFVEFMHQELLKSKALQGDETPVPVLDRSKDSTRTSYIWTTLGDRDHPYTTFHYTDSRSRDGPTEFLKGFEGYLQTDAYASYESVVTKSAGKIIAVGCWAHARRDFFDARHNQPREVHYVLGLIRQLYDIEDQVAGQSDAVRLAARQAQSVPILGRLEAYLREQQTTALPQSQFGKALTYTLNQWDKLVRYTTDGQLEIDNNRSERTLRGWAIGRKNWMFFGNDQGGETAAICMSVIASARRHNIEPVAYVRELLIALSSGATDFRSLLPDVWIAAHPEHFVSYRPAEAEAAARRRRHHRAERRATSGRLAATEPARGAVPPPADDAAACHDEAPDSPVEAPAR
jgi:transposase